MSTPTKDAGKPGDSGSIAGSNLMTSRAWQTTMKALAPVAYDRMMAYYAAVHVPGQLSDKLRHLLWIAVDAVPTHIYTPGIELHARMAMDHGATLEEIAEALEIASTLSERSHVHALPAVIDVARAAGLKVPESSGSLTDRQRQIRDSYVARDGAWPTGLDLALRVMPEYLAAQLQMNHSPAVPGGLDAKSRALIFVAVHACPATLDVAAVRHHAARCIELGATAEELIEVVQAASGISVHAFSLGMPAVQLGVGAR